MSNGIILMGGRKIDDVYINNVYLFDNLNSSLRELKSLNQENRFGYNVCCINNKSVEILGSAGRVSEINTDQLII